MNFCLHFKCLHNFYIMDFARACCRTTLRTTFYFNFSNRRTSFVVVDLSASALSWKILERISYDEIFSYIRRRIVTFSWSLLERSLSHILHLLLCSYWSPWIIGVHIDRSKNQTVESNKNTAIQKRQHPWRFRWIIRTWVFRYSQWATTMCLYLWPLSWFRMNCE